MIKVILPKKYFYHVRVATTNQIILHLVYRIHEIGKNRQYDAYLVLGSIYRITNSLWLCVLYHALLNAFTQSLIIANFYSIKRSHL